MALLRLYNCLALSLESHIRLTHVVSAALFYNVEGHEYCFLFDYVAPFLLVFTVYSTLLRCADISNFVAFWLQCNALAFV